MAQISELYEYTYAETIDHAVFQLSCNTEVVLQGFEISPYSIDLEEIENVIKKLMAVQYKVKNLVRLTGNMGRNNA